MRFLRSFLVAALALVGVTAAAHAETFGAEPYSPDPFEVPVDHYVGFTGHADDGLRSGVSADTLSALRLRAGPLLGLAIGAALIAHGDAEAGAVGFALANGAGAVPAEVTKTLDELKTNIGRVLDLEGDLKTVKDGHAEIKQEIANRSEKTAELIDKAKADIEKANTDRLDAIEMDLAKRFGMGGRASQKTAGELFTESETFTGAPDRKNVGPVMVSRQSAIRGATKDLTLATGQNPPNYTGEIVEPQKPRLAMRDLLPGGRSARPSVEYMKLTQRALNAGTVAAGELKPESNLVWVDATAKMVKIAHYIPVTEEQLSDVDGLRSTIDSELEYGIEKAEDDKILNGPGPDGTDIYGLIPQAVAYDAATYGDTVTNTTIIDHILGAIAQLWVADYAPDGVVLNPIDWFKILSQKTNEGAYIFAMPQSMAQPRLWGLPVVPTNQMAAADILTGAFQVAAQLYDGQLQGEYGIQIRTGQPGDYFLRNKYAVLAEERIMLQVKRPGALVYHDSDAA